VLKVGLIDDIRTKQDAANSVTLPEFCDISVECVCFAKLEALKLIVVTQDFKKQEEGERY
jgi:hypothetical protein